MDASESQIKERIERIKAIRKHLGWSEETCAHHLGVTFSTLNRWERGESLPNSQLVIDAIDRFLVEHEKNQP